jgi:tRNA(fMet)-specific endonuclease VapC
VDVLRGIGIHNLAISIVTTGELYFGVKDRRELHKIKSHLSQVQRIPLNADISALAVTLLEEYVLSHKLSLPDALIAANAIQQGLPLYTLNIKDFHYIPDLQLHQPLSN